MTINRRTFLLAGVAGLAAVSTHGARALARTLSQAAAPAAPAAAAGAALYGEGVRAQVFEVIVRQAMAGAPWREICVGPMMVNNIKPEDVEAEAMRRVNMLGKHPHTNKQRHPTICKECVKEIASEHDQHHEWIEYCQKCDEQVAAQHPHHSDTLLWRCVHCQKEIWERRNRVTSEHASHAGFTEDCNQCWRDQVMRRLRHTADQAAQSSKRC